MTISHLLHDTRVALAWLPDFQDVSRFSLFEQSIPYLKGKAEAQSSGNLQAMEADEATHTMTSYQNSDAGFNYNGWSLHSSSNFVLH